TTLLLATQLPWPLWTAAAMSVLAIALLHRPPAAPGIRARHGHTILFALLAAAAYALFDVLVQKWSPAWGAGRFLPIMFALSAAFSGGFVPFFREPLRALPRAAWPALGAGALFMALQAFALVSAVALFGDATAINVVYSARGLWSVVAVWLVGHWFANVEGQLGAGVLRWRLAGAALMTAAIVIVVTQ
ncbi:MAG: EamA/RhaT family transporter, partial [Verrucomicrobiota bacterium]|nr:EamA/RhaT family transporter [Verrucomicrobiota bacterium]